ncbi:MAG: hypothetical protein GC151_19875 [Betaproteobacteria bacterium]|nr:hypothetical protein [Betaproteobacteria bacterium]
MYPLRRFGRLLAAPVLIGWIAAVLPFLPAANARAADARMTVIEFHFVAAWIKPDSFDGETRKLWRYKDRFLRFEEPLNPVTGAQGLLVTNEPDTWVVDQVSKRGHHGIDPGPTYNVVFPVFPSGMPDSLKGLQMGREAAFFQSHGGVPQSPETLDGIECDVLKIDQDGTELRLWLRQGTNKAVQVSLKNEKVEYAVRYDKYANDVPLDMTLFSEPAGVDMSEPAK